MVLWLRQIFPQMPTPDLDMVVLMAFESGRIRTQSCTPLQAAVIAAVGMVGATSRKHLDLKVLSDAIVGLLESEGLLWTE